MNIQPILFYNYTYKLQYMPLDLTPSDSELLLFQRLNHHVATHRIPLTAFWHSTRLCLSLQQFLPLLTDIRFQPTHLQLQALATDSVQFINLAAVLSGVQYWKEQHQSVAAFLSYQQQEKQAIRESEGKKKEVKVSRIDGRVRTASSRSSRSQYANMSRAVTRQLQAEIKLTNTLIKTKNESDYELTIKVGEANDLCKSLKNSFSYLLDSTGDQTKIIEIDGKSGQQKTIKQKVFEKKYEEYKLTSLSRGQEIEGTLEEDLKKTLVEVMCLSDELEEQIRLLERKGIGH